MVMWWCGGLEDCGAIDMKKKIALFAIVICAFTLAKTEAQEESKPLSKREAAIVDIASSLARGEQKSLALAFKEAFGTGLTLNEAKEIISQLYAYCGFPRALNAAATLRIVADDLNPREGPRPGPLPQGPSIVFGTAVQTKLCGREVKGGIYSFVPQLDEYLKAHLFGDIFARDTLTWREREIATLGALAARNDTEPQLKAHLKIGQNVGLKEETMREIVRHVQVPSNPDSLSADWSIFAVGQANSAFKNYFNGNSYKNELSCEKLAISTITFEPGARNDWHIHHATSGGGQILIVTAGKGIYQEEGKAPQLIKPGETVNIPANTKHWHGAAQDSWFQHLEIEVPGEESFTEWCGEVDNVTYTKAWGEIK